MWKKTAFMLLATTITIFPLGTVGHFSVLYFLLIMFVHFIVERFGEELVSISKALKGDDLKHMKFIMGEHLPNGNLQSVKLPIELFELMIQHGMLSETNLAPLAQLLTDVKRKDLSSKLQIKGKR